MNLNAKKLTTVDHLDACANLRVLYLYENGISAMRGFDSLTNLTDLYLAHNRITRIEGLGCLRGLKKLYLDNNFIQRVEGLAACTQLEELTLNNQRFLATAASVQHDGGGAVALSFDADSLAAIAPTLRSLQLSNSRAVDIAPLAVLSALHVLHLANNPIHSFDDVAAVLGATDQLRELRLRHVRSGRRGARGTIHQQSAMANVSIIGNANHTHTSMSDVFPYIKRSVKIRSQPSD